MAYEEMVGIAAGDRAPWADLPLSCPTCGGDPLPLVDGPLPFIHCDGCHGTWLRGNPNLNLLFGEGNSTDPRDEGER